jgi:hypothetical protein
LIWYIINISIATSETDEQENEMNTTSSNREISSVKVLNNKWNTIIYVNFVDQSRSGERRCDHQTKTWTTSFMSDAELKNAKALACAGGTWTNYSKPRQQFSKPVYDTDLSTPWSAEDQTPRNTTGFDCNVEG